MQVAPVQKTTTVAPENRAAASEKTGTLDYDAFLRLLIAQLKNQDPTEPMDSAQYVAQLASFSNVEQSLKLNAKLDTLITAQALSHAESFIGRNVVSADGAIAGKVTGLRIIDGGAIALLEGRQELPLGPGVTVSGA